MRSGLVLATGYERRGLLPPQRDLRTSALYQRGFGRDFETRSNRLSFSVHPTLSVNNSVADRGGRNLHIHDGRLTRGLTRGGEAWFDAGTAEIDSAARALVRGPLAACLRSKQQAHGLCVTSSRVLSMEELEHGCGRNSRYATPSSISSEGGSLKRFAR